METADESSRKIPTSRPHKGSALARHTYLDIRGDEHAHQIGSPL